MGSLTPGPYRPNQVTIGFVDVGYLHAEGARAINSHVQITRVDPGELVNWVRRCAVPTSKVFGEISFGSTDRTAPTIPPMTRLLRSALTSTGSRQPLACSSGSGICSHDPLVGSAQ